MGETAAASMSQSFVTPRRFSCPSCPRPPPPPSTDNPTHSSSILASWQVTHVCAIGICAEDLGNCVDRGLTKFTARACPKLHFWPSENRGSVQLGPACCPFVAAVHVFCAAVGLQHRFPQAAVSRECTLLHHRERTHVFLPVAVFPCRSFSLGYVSGNPHSHTIPHKDFHSSPWTGILSLIACIISIHSSKLRQNSNRPHVGASPVGTTAEVRSGHGGYAEDADSEGEGGDGGGLAMMARGRHRFRMVEDLGWR